MKNLEFLVLKAHDLINELTQIDIDVIKKEKKHSLAKEYNISTVHIERTVSNLQIVDDLIFQAELLFSQHPMKDMFNDRLKSLIHKGVYDFNQEQTARDGAIKTLNEFINYIKSYEI